MMLLLSICLSDRDPFTTTTGTDDSHRPLAFVHFRFTLQGEAVGVEGGRPALYIMDIQVEPEVQRKGLGCHLMQIAEIIACKQGMMHLMMPVVVKDEKARMFLLSGLSGFQQDDLSTIVSYDGQDASALLAGICAVACLVRMSNAVSFNHRMII